MLKMKKKVVTAQEKKKALDWFKKYHRLVNYIGAAQLYLKDNFLLERPLRSSDIKDRILGHWGTVPGLNFIYEHFNFLISKHDVEAFFIAGPGHGAPAVLANLFLEGTLKEYYPQYTVDGKGMGHLLKDFSWPYGFQSHVTPHCPGSILEGGELGYSLSTAFGAAMDNPNLIVACVIGDGEAESGPLAASWHGNKFLNPRESGAVLPIVHVNGYKISGPSIYSTMTDEELEHLFLGYGYKPYFVVDEENSLHQCMTHYLEKAYQDIREIQRKAREENCVTKTAWPVIIFRSMKGWTGTKMINGKKVEDNYRSHGIPIKDPKNNPKDLQALQDWLHSYRIDELVDSKGRPTKEVMEFVPKGKFRMGMNKHTFGGEVLKALKMPKVEKFEFEGKHGEVQGSSTAIAAQFLNQIFIDNKKTGGFRYFCPDETESNLMEKIFEGGGREYVWPVKPEDECIVTTGKVTEMLSETTLQGFLQGYLLTGRHGLFATYEAFGMINASMVDQYCKFIKQTLHVKWRKPIASLNYLLTSLGWRQEHNGYSHQNPSLVANALEKHGEFTSVYFPTDGNSYMVTMQDNFTRKNGVNIVVQGKQKMPQWLSVEEARNQMENGVMVWDWVGGKGSKDPDVVFAASGDHMLLEVMAAIDILRREVPGIHQRLVYVSEMTSFGLGKANKTERVMGKDFEKYFGATAPIIYNFHGYAHSVQKLLFKHPHAGRFFIHGYREEGGTTTPYDMQVRNGTSRWHLVVEALQKGAMNKLELAGPAKKVIKKYQKLLDQHKAYIIEHGKDLDEVTNWTWKN